MRGILFLILVLVLIVGGAWFLAGRAHEEPTRQIEIDVSSEAAKQ
jgi:hypothetical protein